MSTTGAGLAGPGGAAAGAAATAGAAGAATTWVARRVTLVVTLLVVRTGAACDFSSVLLENQQGGVLIGFALGVGHCQAAGPFAAYVGGP